MNRAGERAWGAGVLAVAALALPFAAMADEPRLIVQVPAGGEADRRLREDPPASLSAGDVAVQRLAVDQQGALDPPPVGQVVLTIPSPETLRRDPGSVREVVDGAGAGAEPIVIVVEAAEELRDEELAAVREAAGRARRPVILRVIRDG